MILLSEESREVHIAKQTEAILFSFEKRRSITQLIEMNGERCAQRQVTKLQVYERLQGKVAAA